MTASDRITEVFLQPGGFYFGGRDTRIRTLLGSCVSITLWHPGRRIGGMCHYLLPRRVGCRLGPLDGRYAEEALDLFLQEVRTRKTHPSEYQVKLFGGGNMFPCLVTGEGAAIAAKNIEVGRRLLLRYGFELHAEDAGGAGHRQVVFELWSGHVWMKRTPLSGVIADGG